MKVTQTIRVMTPRDALGTAIVLALEGLFFVCAEGFADQPPADDTVEATVEFKGSARGAVTVTMPKAYLAMLASGFAPEESLGAPLDALAQSDLLLELANIVCGNVVPRIYGRAEVYDLSPPRLGAHDGPRSDGAVILVDGGWVAATLHGGAS